jgi:hypothetical protein
MSSLILFLGTALVARVLLLSGGINPALGWGLAFIPVLTVLSIVGNDSILMSALAWIPLLALFLSAIFLVSKAGLIRNALPLILITTLVSVVCARSANHFAVLAAVSAIFVARRLQGDDIFALRDSSSLIGVIIPLLPALFILLGIPSAPFPDYPPLAHVVPDDGLVGIVRPLLGFDYPIQVIDRGVVKSSFGPLTLSLTLISLGAVALGLRGLTPLAFALSICGALDTLLPESLAQIAPIAALSRIIPWGTTVAYSPYIVAIAAWILALSLVTSARRIIAIPLLCGLLITTRALSPVTSTTEPENTLVSALQETSPSTAVVRYLARGVSATSTNDLKRPLLDGYTPSFEPLTAFGASVNASLGDTTMMLKVVSDSDPRTRWSTQRGGQHGDERIEISFSKPTTVSGIELDTGTFTTDFPRGLTVVGTNGSSNPTRCHAEFPSWQGSIARTPSGHPYFTGQHEVRIIFPEPCLLTTLSLKQTGSAPFDWSIAEIRIAH